MRREQKIMALLVVMAIFTVMVVLLPGMVNAGSLDPSGPPGSTMKTLDEIPPAWNKIIPGSERFELCMGGAAVLDKETGLVWERSPDTTQRIWLEAYNYCSNKQIGGRKGWRLPTKEELASLVDMSAGGAPYIPTGHPFSNVQSSFYWSATTYVGAAGDAWGVDFGHGGVGTSNKSATAYESNAYYVWCVRGGHD